MGGPDDSSVLRGMRITTMAITQEGERADGTISSLSLFAFPLFRLFILRFFPFSLARLKLYGQ